MCWLHNSKPRYYSSNQLCVWAFIFTCYSLFVILSKIPLHKFNMLIFWSVVCPSNLLKGKFLPLDLSQQTFDSFIYVLLLLWIVLAKRRGLISIILGPLGLRFGGLSSIDSSPSPLGGLFGALTRALLKY